MKPMTLSVKKDVEEEEGRCLRQKGRIAIQDLKLKGVKQCDMIRMGYSRSLVKTWYNRDSLKEKKGKKPKLTAEMKQRTDNEMKGKVGVGTRTVAKVLAVSFKRKEENGYLRGLLSKTMSSEEHGVATHTT